MHCSFCYAGQKIYNNIIIYVWGISILVFRRKNFAIYVVYYVPTLKTKVLSLSHVKEDMATLYHTVVNFSIYITGLGEIFVQRKLSAIINYGI